MSIKYELIQKSVSWEKQVVFTREISRPLMKIKQNNIGIDDTFPRLADTAAAIKSCYSTHR
jgi:hypothetical protein